MENSNRKPSNLSSLPTRQYLDTTVNPILLQGEIELLKLNFNVSH